MVVTAITAVFSAATSVGAGTVGMPTLLPVMPEEVTVEIPVPTGGESPTST